MGDIVNINDITDMQLLERFNRLESIVPDCLEGVSVNPFIQHIKDAGEISISLIDFLSQSEFLDLLTPELVLISQELFDKKADTEWFRIMLSIIEEKEDVESFCESILLCVDSGIKCEDVREMIEKCKTCTDMINVLNTYVREHQTSKFDVNTEEAMTVEYYKKLCKQQEIFISQLLTQIEDLKLKQKELSRGLEEATFHSEFASIDVEERCKELEMQNSELAKQYADMKKMYDDCSSEKMDSCQLLEDEKTCLLSKVESLESNIQNMTVNLNIIERQLQNATNNWQVAHKRFIEQKRNTLKYRLQSEKLQKQITDISETKMKCENLENTVVSLKEEKTKLEEKLQEALAKEEQFCTINDQQEDKIKKLENTLSDFENKVNYLQMQNKTLEQQLQNPVIVNNSSFSSNSTMLGQDLYDSKFISQEEEKEDDIKEFSESQMISFEAGNECVKKKSNWFTKLITQHSKKTFLKNSRQDQENLIFIKMMEMHYPSEKVQKIRNSLSENVPCFDLYKLICGEPSIDELEAFFNRYSQTDEAIA